LKLRNY